jgi:hypothetical protein
MINKNVVAIIISLFLIAVLGYVDYITGYEFSFFVFYFIPISILAWYSSKPYGGYLQRSNI